MGGACLAGHTERQEKKRLVKQRREWVTSCLQRMCDTLANVVMPKLVEAAEKVLSSPEDDWQLRESHLLALATMAKHMALVDLVVEHLSHPVVSHRILTPAFISP